MTNGFQLVMPLDCEVNIEKNAPVRLLNAVMERMDYSKLYAAYSRLGRIEYSPKILLKIMVYGYMRKQISSRALEACCRENLHFIYLLEGQRAPDHNTINRFRKNILTQEAGQDILCQLVVLLHERGLLSLEAAFIDGTKIEANANKYSFVWKKATAQRGRYPLSCSGKDCCPTIEEALEKNPCANQSGWNRACFRKRQKKNAAAETERMGRSMSCQTQAIHK